MLKRLNENVVLFNLFYVLAKLTWLSHCKKHTQKFMQKQLTYMLGMNLKLIEIIEYSFIIGVQQTERRQSPVKSFFCVVCTGHHALWKVHDPVS